MSERVLSVVTITEVRLADGTIEEREKLIYSAPLDDYKDAKVIPFERPNPPRKARAKHKI